MKVIVTGRGIRRPARRIEKEFGISRREAVALKHKRCLNVSREIGEKLIAAGLAIAAPLDTPVFVTPEDSLEIVTPEADAAIITLEVEAKPEEPKVEEAKPEEVKVEPPRRRSKGDNGGRL